MNKKIVIDAGHGGDDPGTIANNIVEKDYTLEISKYIKQRLDDLGIDSFLTREDDITLGPDKRPRVAQSKYGNGSDVILISNHINAGGGDGAEVIYSLRNNDTLANIIAEEFIKSGQNVRKTYQRRLPSNPSKDYYYILRDTPNNESLIIEYGFADSKGDDVALLKNRWKDLAEGVVRALAKYLDIPYLSANEQESSEYVVVNGDTLWNIAKKLGVSVNELKEVNQLTSNLLKVGQVLMIPGIKPNDEQYVVKSGDTLYSISKKYSMSVNDIKRINHLTSDTLSVGQVLFLKEKGQEESSLPEDSYKVQKGDSLYAIARKYKVSIKDLMEVNNLTSNVISVGQVLKIPSLEEKVYTVKAGDTLWNIAKSFQTTVDSIIKENNLISNILKIGQKLLIP